MKIWKPVKVKGAMSQRSNVKVKFMGVKVKVLKVKGQGGWVKVKVFWEVLYADPLEV